MLFKTHEIRWFTNTPFIDIKNWFNQHGIFFADQSPRIDYYLPLPGQDDLGIKWREGRMEIKKRLGSPEVKQLAPRAVGLFEQWVKWSFALANANDAKKLIAYPGAPAWLEVKKERLTLVYTEGIDNKVVLQSNVSDASSGCQLEYSRIQVGGRTWYTFGLEWFGEKFIRLPDNLLEKVFGGTKLNTPASCGYAEFFCREVYG